MGKSFALIFVLFVLAFGEETSPATEDGGDGVLFTEPPTDEVNTTTTASPPTSSTKATSVVYSVTVPYGKWPESMKKYHEEMQKSATRIQKRRDYFNPHPTPATPLPTTTVPPATTTPLPTTTLAPPITPNETVKPPAKPAINMEAIQSIIREMERRRRAGSFQGVPQFHFVQKNDPTAPKTPTQPQSIENATTITPPNSIPKETQEPSQLQVSSEVKTAPEPQAKWNIPSLESLGANGIFHKVFGFGHPPTQGNVGVTPIQHVQNAPPPSDTTGAAPPPPPPPPQQDTAGTTPQDSGSAPETAPPPAGRWLWSWLGYGADTKTTGIPSKPIPTRDPNIIPDEEGEHFGVKIVLVPASQPIPGEGFYESEFVDLPPTPVPVVANPHPAPIQHPAKC